MFPYTAMLIRRPAIAKKNGHHARLICAPIMSIFLKQRLKRKLRSNNFQKARSRDRPFHKHHGQAPTESSCTRFGQIGFTDNIAGYEFCETDTCREI